MWGAEARCLFWVALVSLVALRRSASTSDGRGRLTAPDRPPYLCLRDTTGPAPSPSPSPPLPMEGFNRASFPPMPVEAEETVVDDPPFVPANVTTIITFAIATFSIHDTYLHSHTFHF